MIICVWIPKIRRDCLDYDYQYRDRRGDGMEGREILQVSEVRQCSSYINLILNNLLDVHHGC